MPSFPRRLAACCLALFSILPGAQAAELNHNGHVFRFDQRVETAPGDLHGQAAGTMSVRRAGDQALLLQIDTPLNPGCGAVPAVYAIDDTLVALCGHLGGRHYTQTVIRIDQPLNVASIDQHDGAQRLQAGPDGMPQTAVLARDFFAGELTGPHYFPRVYRLRRDNATFGWQPVFDSAAAPLYLRSYRDERAMATTLAEQLPQALAALVASGDNATICRELATLQAAPGIPALLATWLRRLPEIGYPAFDLRQCRVAE